ncbi:MAG: RNA polymerase II mediator complex subunit [Caeruleum heppii]|nr:MAG: RNA polymerase II mediator complex subunit [Caeruleum heppii]
MAPVTIETLETQLKNTIQHLYETAVILHAYQVPESERALREKILTLHTTLQSLIATTSTNPTNPTSQNPPSTSSTIPSSSPLSIPPEVITYVDAGRNPDIYTRQFVEVVREWNDYLGGKASALDGFESVLLREVEGVLGEEVRGLWGGEGKLEDDKEGEVERGGVGKEEEEEEEGKG